MQIQTQTVVVAGTVNDNVVAGNQFEFAPTRAVLQFGLVASATGLELDILIGSRSVITRLLPSILNRVPVVPDDFSVTTGVLPGERIIVRARNPTGGNITLFTSVMFTPR